MNWTDPSQSPAILHPKLQHALILGLATTLPAIATITWISDHKRQRTHEDRQVSTPAFLIDLNQATEPELNLLPGVGPLSARRIIQNRNTSGPFRSFEDLQRVPGIGRKTAAGMKPFCKPLGPPDQPSSGHRNRLMATE